MLDGRADESTGVYWCVVCGPCLMEETEGGVFWALHKDIPHPDLMNYDGEQNLQ